MLAVDAENQRLGRLVLFGFLLEHDEKKQINTFNKILSEVGLFVRLEKHRDGFYWIDDETGDSIQAEEMFCRITEFIPEKKLRTLLDQGRLGLLLDQYDEMMRNERQRIETLRWLSEFPD